MGDMAEVFNAMQERSREKRASNRESSLKILIERGVSHQIKNGGAHIIVQGRDCLIDFWPGTGKFITRQGKHGRGVFNLLKLCRTGNHVSHGTM